MKFNNKIFSTLLLGAAALMSCMVFSSCEDQPDKYETSGGTPEIYYIRMSDVAAKDSLVTGAYLGSYITLVGQNLRSIVKMYFNDKEAVLNSSLITDNTLIVQVPKELSDNPTNKIYMVNNANDTTEYNFTALVPNPVLTSMSNEEAKAGDVVTLYGDYLLNYDSYPLQITMPGNVQVTNFLSISKTSCSFVVPDGVQPGYVTAQSMYGTGRSTFYFDDNRYVLFDWDNDGDAALASGHGWRNGNVSNSIVPPLDGNYLVFKGNMLGGIGATWGEDDFSFDYWPDTANGYPELSSLADFSDPTNMSLKFEVYVPNTWSASSLQIIFTGNDEVTYATGTNAYISSDATARALWTPWYSLDKGYTTSGWRTVTIPLSDLKYKPDGATASKTNSTNFTGLTFFVWKGPYEGTDCSPVICIDNIRVTPNK
jgi:hypothetical protein